MSNPTKTDVDVDTGAESKKYPHSSISPMHWVVKVDEIPSFNSETEIPFPAETVESNLRLANDIAELGAVSESGIPGSVVCDGTGDGTGNSDFAAGDGTGAGTGNSDSAASDGTGDGTGDSDSAASDGTGDGAGDSTGDSTGDSVGDSTGAATGAATGDATGAVVDNSMENPLPV